MERKVIFILQHLCIGGIEICVVNAANALAERGYRVQLMCVLTSNEMLDRIDSSIKITYLTSFHSGGKSLLYKLLRRIASYRALRRNLKKLKESILISTRNEYNIMLSKFASSNNLKIAQLHHDYMPYKSLEDDFRKRYSNIDYFLLLTEDVRKEVEDIMKGWNNHTKCVTVPNFFPNKNLPSEAPQSRENIALAVGRLAPEKGYLRLLDIWSIINKRANGKYVLCVVGDGLERKTLENRIKQLGLNDSVKLLGQLPNSQIIGLMQQSKVYCMTSFTEAFPTVLLESLNSGLPQIAFDVRVGPRNIIEDGKTGYLVADGDITTYATKVLDLFQDSEKWTDMSIASKKRAQLFSEDAVMKKWENIINQY